MLPLRDSEVLARRVPEATKALPPSHPALPLPLPLSLPVAVLLPQV